MYLKYFRRVCTSSIVSRVVYARYVSIRTGLSSRLSLSFFFSIFVPHAHLSSFSLYNLAMAVRSPVSVLPFRDSSSPAYYPLVPMHVDLYMIFKDDMANEIRSLNGSINEGNEENEGIDVAHFSGINNSTQSENELEQTDCDEQSSSIRAGLSQPELTVCISKLRSKRGSYI
jgi:hypothetical protein